MTNETVLPANPTRAMRSISLGDVVGRADERIASVTGREAAAKKLLELRRARAGVLSLHGVPLVDGFLVWMFVGVVTVIVLGLTTRWPANDVAGCEHLNVLAIAGERSDLGEIVPAALEIDQDCEQEIAVPDRKRPARR